MHATDSWRMFTLSALFRCARDTLLELLAPRECPGCSGPIGEPVAFCAACCERLERCSTRVVSSVPVWAAGRYSGPLVQPIIALKYHGRSDYARPLAAFALRAARLAPLPPDTLVVPVPLHPLRLSERGYNQAALLGRFIADELRVQFDPVALERVRWLRRQVGLGQDERHQNVSGAFRLRAKSRVRDRPILIVDDVCTTGATAAECVRVVRDAGGLPLAVLVVAVAETKSDAA